MCVWQYLASANLLKMKDIATVLDAPTEAESEPSAPRNQSLLDTPHSGADGGRAARDGGTEGFESTGSQAETRQGAGGVRQIHQDEIPF